MSRFATAQPTQLVTTWSGTTLAAAAVPTCCMALIVSSCHNVNCTACGLDFLYAAIIRTRGPGLAQVVWWHVGAWLLCGYDYSRLVRVQ